MIELHCLEEVFIPFSKLYGIWKTDKRYPETAIQKFISLNRETLEFLGLEVSIDERDFIKGMKIKSSNFVGAAPIRHPKTGTYYEDIVIKSRYGENIPELALLLQETLQPEYIDKPLCKADQLRAPFYFDCINYLNAFAESTSIPWCKFNSTIKVERHPSSSTNWTKYIVKSVDVNNRLSFENRKNILIRDHLEWAQLTSIMQIALHELESNNTPRKIRNQYSELLGSMQSYLRLHPTSKPTNLFIKKTPEPLKIKKLKNLANIIMKYKSTNSRGWRVDSAELFERYVQYVFSEVGRKCGAQVLSNQRFSVWAKPHASWILRYLEPDIIFKKEDAIYFIDAKYKSHMLNTQTENLLKETFRADFHQILAYSSLDSAANKTSMIVYPSNKIKTIELKVDNNLNSVHNRIYLIGLPFTTTELPAVTEAITGIFNRNMLIEHTD